MAAQREIRDAIFELKVDENLIHQKVMAEAEIETQMAVLQAKTFSDIKPPITPDQFAKFKQLEAGLGPTIRAVPRVMPSGTNGVGNNLPPKQ